MGYLDKDLVAAWEANLHGAELDDWKRVRAIVETATPEFRAALTYVLFDLELQTGRGFYAQALADGERFRVDCIKANADSFKGQIRRLDERVAEAVKLIAEFEALAQRVQTAVRVARDVVHVVALARTQFRKVSGPWSDCWPGAAKGRGISKYDTPEGVAQVRREVEQSVSRARAEAEAKARKREGVPEEERPVVRANPKQGPGLFGGTGGGR